MTVDAASFATHVAALERVDRRRSRRRRVVAAVLAVVVVALLAPFAARLYLHRLAPASVDVTGTWVLQSVDHGDRASVTVADLAGSSGGIEFDRSGRFAVTSGCVDDSGTYHVSSDHLWFGERIAGALGCGYATAAAERVGTAVGVATRAVLEHGGVVSSPGTGRLDVTAEGAYVLHYTRGAG